MAHKNKRDKLEQTKPAQKRNATNRAKAEQGDQKSPCNKQGIIMGKIALKEWRGEHKPAHEPRHHVSALKGRTAKAAFLSQSAQMSLLNSREEAEALFYTDRTRHGQNNEWTAHFVTTMVEYLLWQNSPSGKMTDTDLAWLIGIVADKPSLSMPALLFALVREMNDPPEHLMALALRVLGHRLKDIPFFVSSHPIFSHEAYAS